MCGRYALAELRFDELAELLDATPGPSGGAYEASFNIAPTRRVPALTIVDDHRSLDLFRWGLIPPKVVDFAHFQATTFNAGLAESIATRPTYRTAFREHRAIVPATSFFEWRKNGDREPYAFARTDGDLLGFAGLFKQWRHPEGEIIASCTIITCPANADMAAIHDRMPVVLERDAWDRWLAPNLADREALTAMLRPGREGTIGHYAVGRTVGNVQNDRAELLQPVDHVTDGNQTLW